MKNELTIKKELERIRNLNMISESGLVRKETAIDFLTWVLDDDMENK